MNKTLILIVLAFGIGLAGGYLLGVRRQESEASKTVAVLPSPSPVSESKREFDNSEAEVKMADGKSLIYVVGGVEKTLTDLSDISVWQVPAEGSQAAKIDWSGIKAGSKVQIASDKKTGQVVAVLLL